MGTALDARQWLSDFDALVDRLDGSAGEVQALCGLGRAKLDAVEARILAAQLPSDGDTRRAARAARQGGKRSKAAARKAAGRARAVAHNQGLADDLGSGRLSPEQVDLIADAMDTDESAAVDDEFIERIAGASVDQGRKIARDWKTEKTTKNAAEKERARRRRLRSARRYFNTAKGLDTIIFEGDAVSVSEVWNVLEQRERQLHEADGGRDLPAGEHRRTRAQRLFDGLHGLVTGGEGSPMARPSAVVLVPVDPSKNSELAGHGPISDEAARELLLRADLSVMLVNDLTGDPLWLSRTARHASRGQFLALVARDGGCVLCGAAWIRCHAHHLTPYNSPACGETNVDELALLCPGCHHELHGTCLTLVRKPDGTWHTRAALDHEIAPGSTRGDATTKHEHPRTRRNPQPSRPRNPTSRQTPSAVTSNPSLFPRPGTTGTFDEGDNEDDPSQD